MKRITLILLAMCLLLPVATKAQTPYDSFAPETSRPMLEADALYEETVQENHTADTILCAAVIDFQSQSLYLVSLTDGSFLASAPLTDDLRKWLSVDPLVDKNIATAPYMYCLGNPMVYIDKDGRDSIYIYDQKQRPTDNGKKGETYTATIVVIQNGEKKGEYRGSTFPNSVSNEDNSTTYNTLIEGEHSFNNLYGHKGGAQKGLNIVNDEGNRIADGYNSNGDRVTMYNVNVHSGKSDNGNYNSRGSHGCITIHPEDAEAFFRNFTWTNETMTTGTSNGKIFIFRL